MSQHQSIGRYRIVRELGRGGMGIVYEAIDPVIERRVALKTIHNADNLADEVYGELRERFLREAQAAGRLQHPNIVTVLDAGTDDQSGVSFIAMEFVEGTDLDRELDQGRRFSVDDATRIVSGVAAALGYAHEQGVVHRDVKPANIMLDRNGTPKLMDFGIARLEESGLTRTGQVLGSPAYMSPEQITGADVDGRADIFSLGVVFYQLLTGERPFQGEAMTTLAYQIVHTEPIPARQLNPALPGVYDHVLARAMAKDREQRYRKATDLVADLTGGTIVTGSVPSPTGVTGTVVAAPPPATGATGTVVGAPASSAGAAGTVVEAAPAAQPAPAPSGRGAPRWLLPAVAVLGVAAGLFGAMALRGGGGEAPPGGDGAAAAATATPLMIPAPARSTPTPTPATRVATSVPAVEPAGSIATATLAIDFEHHMSDGEVTITVGEQVAWRHPLRAKKKTRLKIPGWKKGKLEVHNEHIQDSMEVPAGDHVVDVKVVSPGSDIDDRERVRMTFRPGGTRLIDISVSRISHEISLEIK